MGVKMERGRLKQKMMRLSLFEKGKSVFIIIQIYLMTTNTPIDSYAHEDKRNIKNIYVHKINSLMKLSKDTQMKEDLENSHNP